MCRAGLHNGILYFTQYKGIDNSYSKILWLVFGVVPGSLLFFLDMLKILVKYSPPDDPTRYRGEQ